MSENREKTIKDEKARLREYLKAIGILIKQQKDIQGRTAGGDDRKQLAGEQGKVADKTGGLAKSIQKNEEKGEDGKAEDAKSDKGKDESGKGKGTKGADGKSEDGKGKSEEGESEKGENANAENQQQNSSQNPARKRLEAARQRMNEAKKKLEDARRRGRRRQARRSPPASSNRPRANWRKSSVNSARRKSSEFWRCSRPASARCCRCKRRSTKGTLRLDKIPTAERTHNQEIESSRLSSKESQIVVEVDKAALLLREDGGAVAFPEAVEQMRDDMQQVVSRLAGANVGKITQGIEEDVIAALKDMIAALKKAQKDQEGKKKKPGESQSGEPQDPPLIDMLAELRMIRTLQMRVNTRTARYSKLIEGEQAENPELVEALRRLAERQERIHRVTRDLELGKNQ